MAAATELQFGKARIYGITGAFTVAITSGYPTQSAVTLTGMDTNPSSISLTRNFKSEEIASSNGAVIESAIHSQQFQDLTLELIPSSTDTTPTRAEAIGLANALMALSPGAIWTLALFDVTVINGTWNYMGGGELVLKRDTYVIANIKLRNYETAATAGTFAALPIAG